MEVNIHVEVFCVVTPCRKPCYLHLYPKGGGSKVLQNYGILQQNYMASQPRTPQFVLMAAEIMIMILSK